MKSIAIVQSNYIPWRGYFDLIDSVDEFVIYDEVQYTKRDWRNRNIIRTMNGLRWLSIPIKVKGRYYQKISEAKVSEPNWAKKHWESIYHNYKKAPFFNLYADFFKEVYDILDTDLLSEINITFIRKINEILGIKTLISSSTSYSIEGNATDRLLNICKQAKANCYVSGPSAKSYFEVEKAIDAGIKVKWFQYTGYPEYKQLFGGFESHVSIIDLIFNVGPEARFQIKSNRL